MSEPVVRVLLFAAVRELLGCSETTVPAHVATANGVLDALVVRCAALAAYRASLRVAVNGVYVAPDAAVCAGDEVAVIPPVAGG
jgi:molybdopterin converting factor subunit 1